KFSPYQRPLAPSPSTVTLRYGACLRPPRLLETAPLDHWLAANITSESIVHPDTRALQEAVCVAFMSVIKGATDGFFKDQDLYLLSVTIELEKHCSYLLVRLASFSISNEDADAPLLTRLLKPKRSHYMFQRRTFAALLMCGMLPLRVESVSEVHFYSFYPMVRFSNVVSSAQSVLECIYGLVMQRYGHRFLYFTAYLIHSFSLALEAKQRLPPTFA
ncbi:hypothetical protein R3P38DRAFT_2549464, partial [Favolaschia claudopus]